MPKISYSLPNLLGGISQQDPVMRLPNQVSEACNFHIDAAQGVRTRPSTIFEGLLTLNADSDSVKFHFIRRDENEKYALAVTDTGQLYAYDLINGVELDVVDNTTDTTAAAYLLSGGNPVNNIRMSTIADSTFIVNRTVTPALIETSRTAAPTNYGIVQITRGLWNLVYNVKIVYENGLYSTASYNTGTPTSQYDTTTFDTGTIAAGLVSAINALSGSGLTATLLDDGDSFGITRASGYSPISAIIAQDNFGGTATRVAFRVVTGRDDLPRYGVAGHVFRVIEDGGEEEYEYYVNWSAEVENPSVEDTYYGNGYWKECVGWETLTDIDQTTMPLEVRRLQYESGEIYFSIELGDWTSRRTGDDDSCPQPSFIGTPISDIFFHQNRIGFLAGENVIMSRTADLKNFWNESARSLYDTDPIDVAASTRDVNNLKAAVPLQGTLLVVGENKQFNFGGSTSFTPGTASMAVTTSHVVEDAIPAVVGSYAYLPVKKGDYSTLREYQIDSITATSVAPDVTKQVDRLIAGEVVGMTASTAYNSLYLHTEDSSGLTPYIYVYQWLEQGQQKVQSSWVRWCIGESVRIYGMAAFDKDIWIVCKRPSDGYTNFALVRMDMSFPTIGSIPFVPSMDFIEDVSSLVYDSEENVTTITLTDLKQTGERPFLLFKEDNETLGLKAGDNLTGITWNESYTIGTVKGDISTAELIYGYPMECLIEFSTQYVREGQGGSGSIVDGRLQLIEGRIPFNDSGEFVVEVDMTAHGGHLYQYPKSGLLGDSNFLYGNPYLSTGVLRFAVLSQNTMCTIRLRVEKFYPVTIQKLEWSGLFTLNSQRT